MRLATALTGLINRTGAYGDVFFFRVLLWEKVDDSFRISSTCNDDEDLSVLWLYGQRRVVGRVCESRIYTAVHCECGCVYIHTVFVGKRCIGYFS